MSTPEYTNLMILKTTHAKIKPACEKLSEELYKATGIRTKITQSTLVSMLVERYMKGEKKS
jgi:hypothetical protein